jgi:hypothetical protein
MKSTPSSSSREALRGLCGLALAISLGASAQPVKAWEDHMATGFERMLSHSPYAGPTALSFEAEFDPLLLTIAKVRRSGHWIETPAPPDESAMGRSFQRMLSSQPAAATGGRPSRPPAGPRS